MFYLKSFTRILIEIFVLDVIVLLSFVLFIGIHQSNIHIHFLYSCFSSLWVHSLPIFVSIVLYTFFIKYEFQFGQMKYLVFFITGILVGLSFFVLLLNFEAIDNVQNAKAINLKLSPHIHIKKDDTTLFIKDKLFSINHLKKDASPDSLFIEDNFILLGNINLNQSYINFYPATSFQKTQNQIDEKIRTIENESMNIKLFPFSLEQKIFKTWDKIDHNISNFFMKLDPKKLFLIFFCIISFTFFYLSLGLYFVDRHTPLLNIGFVLFYSTLLYFIVPYFIIFIYQNTQLNTLFKGKNEISYILVGMLCLILSFLNLSIYNNIHKIKGEANETSR